MCFRCDRLISSSQSPLSRRRVMAFAGAAALAVAASGRGFAEVAKAPPKPENAISADAALERLMKGNTRYIDGVTKRHDFKNEREALAGGQNPFAGILNCADSRVAPELAFDEGPGELFVVRVAGNFVTPDLLASLEYGVKFLGVPFIFVLGHSRCGAVDAAIKVLKTKASLPGHLPDLVTALKPAVIVAEKTRSGDLLDNAIAENVRRQVARLKEARPVIAKFYAAKAIDIAGGVYDLETGKITVV